MPCMVCSSGSWAAGTSYSRPPPWLAPPRLCRASQVSKLPAGQINTACRALTQHRKCSWHNNLKFGRTKDWVGRVEGVPDIEELVSVGRGNSLCPFFMAKDLGKVSAGGGPSVVVVVGGGAGTACLLTPCC